MHYSRSGYNGNYTYTAVCGKEVRTHQDSEDTSINPTEINCPECLASSKYQTDLHDQTELNTGIKRRIYIESDILQASEFNSACRQVHRHVKDLGLECVDRIFSQVLDFAWHDLEKTWAAVKQADEIYATSSLLPLSGGSYMGAPVIFNGMCERAISEGITGKSVIILNSLQYVNWYMIDIPKMKEAFKNNELYMFNDDWKISKINTNDIKK